MPAYPNLNPAALFGLAQSSKIEAIKALRNRCVGLGLKEAKDAIDHALSLGERRGVDFLTGALTGTRTATVSRAAEIVEWTALGNVTVAQFVLRGENLIVASGDGTDVVTLPAEHLPRIIEALRTLLPDQGPVG